MINEIRNKCRHNYSKEIRDMGIRLIKFNGENGILRCSHIEKDNAIKLLKSINKISSNKVEIETVRTSGTIKTLEKKTYEQVTKKIEAV